MAPQQETSLFANRKCLLICCAVATANMQYGLDSAAIGALQAMPGFLRVFGYPDPTNPTGYGIDPVVQQLIASLLTLGSFLSSMLAGVFGHWFGRRAGLWLACALNVVSCIVMISTTSVGALYLGRLLLGISNGFLVTFSNVYTSEASPAHLRGVIVALFAWWVNIGSIVGAVIVNYTRAWLDKRSYQVPIGCLFIVPLVLSVALWFVPESPRFLVYQGKDEAAKRALETLRGDAVDKAGLELEWAEMLRGVEEEKRNAKSVGFVDMFRGTDLRRTLLCYGMIACQTASGIWFLIAYQTYFLLQGGVRLAFEYSIMTTCLGFLGVNIGMYAMRHLLGRRSILILGASACGLAQLGMAIAYSVPSNFVSGVPTSTATNSLVAFLALHKFFYNGCVGAASYPVATELVSTRLRAYTVGSATSLGYVLAWLTSFCSPYFINPTELNWGAKYGYIWAASNFACVVFFWLCMPEMKGRSLEELDEMFQARVGVRKFRGYVCVVREDARRDVKVGGEEGVFVGDGDGDGDGKQVKPEVFEMEDSTTAATTDTRTPQGNVLTTTTEGKSVV